MMHRFFLMIWIASTCLAKADERPTLIFLLAGQSNMVGFGVTAELPKSWSMPENALIWNQGTWDRLDALSSRFGPELGFAKVLAAELPSERIGIVKFAKGGTGIDEWSPGNSASLYGQLLAQYRKALASAPDARTAGMLWVQGERDSNEQNLAVTYAGKLERLVAAARSDTETEDMPFLCAQINPPYPFANIVRDAQKKLPKSVPQTAMVSTVNLRKLADNLHYNSRAQIELGERFAKAYLRISKQKKKRDVEPAIEESVANIAFADGAVYEGDWTNHAAGAIASDAFSRITVTVVSRDDDHVDTEWELHKWSHRWRFKGNLRLEKTGQAVFSSSDVTLLDGNHPNEGNTTVEVKFDRNARAFKGTAYYKSGRRSEFEAELVNATELGLDSGQKP